MGTPSINHIGMAELKQPVQDLLSASGIKLTNDGLKELEQF